MGPYESFLSGKPVISDDRCRGAARGRARRVDGTRRRSGRRPRWRAAAVWLRDHPDEARGVRARRATRSPTRSPGIARSGGCSREGRALQPDAAGAVGHRRLLRAPAPGAARPLRDRRRQARGEEAAARDRSLRLPHRQQPGRSRLDRRGAASRRPVSSCCTTSSCTTSSPASRSAAATGTATSTRWSARAASSGGCSGTPSSTSGSRRSGRTGPRTSISPERCSGSPQG